MLKFIQYVALSSPLAYQIQQLKNKLSCLPKFNPYTIFQILDLGLKGYITAEDLKIFCLFNDFNDISLISTYLIDSNLTGQITYTDFYNYFLLKQNYQHYNQKMNVNIKSIIQHLMKDILIKEVQYISISMKLRQIFEVFNERDIKVIFEKIDNKNLEMLNSQSLIKFMKNFGNIDIPESYTNSFLKKEFKSAIISISEFYKFFENSNRFMNIYKIIQINDSQFSSSSSNLKHPLHSQNLRVFTENSSTLKTRTKTISPESIYTKNKIRTKIPLIKYKKQFIRPNTVRVKKNVSLTHYLQQFYSDF